ncbi:MAG: hypothetical protein FJ388_07390 [Verrucomicrobia bacterium]|nr:hypothetical protein [Verrucomicrobiota bacterium]
MSTVQEIKEAVAELTPAERSALARWLAEAGPDRSRSVEAVMSTFGSCRDGSLAAIFEEIAKHRHADQGREIPVP